MDLLLTTIRIEIWVLLKSGNLELYEDNIGLRAIATVTDEQVIEKARNKELRGWSFGFVSEKIHGKKANRVFKNDLLKN